MGDTVWSHDGLICTGETYKNALKMTFSRGASLDDPSGLFHASQFLIGFSTPEM